MNRVLMMVINKVQSRDIPKDSFKDYTEIINQMSNLDFEMVGDLVSDRDSNQEFKDVMKKHLQSKTWISVLLKSLNIYTIMKQTIIFELSSIQKYFPNCKTLLHVNIEENAINKPNKFLSIQALT